MGLLGALLTLPLAPARGAFWAIGVVVDEAEAQMNDPKRIRAALVEAELALERGELSEAEYEEIERELLDRLHG